jgi:DNA-binding NarL/FixJ family response regulator
MDILVIDQHILFREGLVKLLDQQPGYRVIGDTNTVRNGIILAIHYRPQLILIGIDRLDYEEVEAIKRICSKLHHSRVVLLFDEEPSDLLIEAIQWGVKGFIPKNTPLSNVLRALRALTRDEVVIPRKLTKCITDELIRLHGALKAVDLDPYEVSLELLTPREQEVLYHLGTGASNQAIAHNMAISVNTVRVHVHNVLEKLELRNRREASRYCKEWELKYKGAMMQGASSH